MEQRGTAISVGVPDTEAECEPIPDERSRLVVVVHDAQPPLVIHVLLGAVPQHALSISLHKPCRLHRRAVGGPAEAAAVGE